MPDSISPFDRPLTHKSFFNIVYFSLISLSDVAEVKRRLDFLFEHSYAVNDFVLVPVGVAFSWSRKINSQLTVARLALQRGMFS